VVKGIPRWAFAVVAVVVVAIAADAAVFVATGPKKAAGAPRPPSEGVAVIDAHDGRVVDHLLVGSQPTQVMSNGGAVWVLNKSTAASAASTRARATWSARSARLSLRTG
jgi:hypothetical protein